MGRCTSLLGLKGRMGRRDMIYGMAMKGGGIDGRLIMIMIYNGKK